MDSNKRTTFARAIASFKVPNVRSECKEYMQAPRFVALLQARDVSLGDVRQT